MQRLLGGTSPVNEPSPQVEIEMQREGREFSISARSERTNFVLSMPLEAAAAFAAACHCTSDGESDEACARFILSKATLEVST